MRSIIVLVFLLSASVLGCSTQEQQQAMEKPEQATTQKSPVEKASKVKASDPQPSSKPKAASQAQLPQTESEIANALIEAINNANVEALQKQVVTEKEYKSVLFPEFAKGKAQLEGKERLHWFLLTSRTRNGMFEILSEFKGKSLTLESASAKSGTDYDGFTIYKDFSIQVRVEGEEKSQKLSPIGSLIKFPKGYKLLSFPS